ncbi:MAG: hypothetical protein ABI460_12580 [Caldimonas sp.]
MLFHSELLDHQADAARTSRTSAFALLGDDILDFSKIEAGRLPLSRARRSGAAGADRVRDEADR